MGAKYTETISRKHALDFINENINLCKNETFKGIVERINDDRATGSPLGLCNFTVVDYLEQEKETKVKNFEN